MLRRNGNIKVTAGAVLILVSYFSMVFGAGTDIDTVEKIEGTVIAYDYVKAWVPCHKGECEGSLIVRVDTPDQMKPRYVKIDFRFAAGKPPRKLVERKRPWQFKLIRTSNLDEPIYEFIEYQKSIHGEDKKIPIWRLIPGAENEKLPFGEILPSYSLVKSGFKPVRH